MAKVNARLAGVELYFDNLPAARRIRGHRSSGSMRGSPRSSPTRGTEILGVHIIGPQATELISEAVAAMELEATVEDLMSTIHAHPTLAESMLDASNSVYGMAINA